MSNLRVVGDNPSKKTKYTLVVYHNGKDVTSRTFEEASITFSSNYATVCLSYNNDQEKMYFMADKLYYIEEYSK